MFRGGFGGFDGFPGFSNQDPEEGAPSKQVDNSKYYEVLEVDKKATTQQIRKAFRKKALKMHPDKGGDPEKFKELSNAYQVLSNPEKRQLYDDYGQQGVKNGGPPGGQGFGGLFDLFSGGGRRKQAGPRKGKPKLIELQVTLQEVFHGAMKNVKIKRTRICEPCEGKGGKNCVKCTKCKGTGVVIKMVQLGPGMYSQSQTQCGDCKGEGEIMKEQDRCKNCKGKKVIEVEKNLQVAIQSGCPNQHDYIFTGQHDQYPGIIAGDIYVRIKIKKHPLFERRGADLIHIKKISLLQALTGVTIELTHLSGNKHVIATAPGEIIHNEELKTIRGLGMPFYKDPMSHGHLYIQFIVNFPKKSSISNLNLQKIGKVLGGKPIKSEGYSKTNKNKILEEFNEKNLNENPTGGDDDEDNSHRFGAGGGRQQVRCQQQ